MSNESIVYRSDRKLSVAEFADVLGRTSLGERRPIADQNRLQLMLHHGNVLITAWDNEKLVGVSRALTDFSFCCYLSDLAVDEGSPERSNIPYITLARVQIASMPIAPASPSLT